VNGKTVYGIDAMLPGMVFATIAASPVFGGKVAHVDDSAAKACPGVQKVIVLDDMVAVVGDHMWAAKQGLEALRLPGSRAARAGRTSPEIWEDLRAPAPRTAPSPSPSATSTRALEQGESGTTPPTSCRSSRTPPWSP
jgi:isoquinoline 1-oxidoreductase beta subunit